MCVFLDRIVKKKKKRRKKKPEYLCIFAGGEPKVTKIMYLKNSSQWDLDLTCQSKQWKETSRVSQSAVWPLGDLAEIQLQHLYKHQS